MNETISVIGLGKLGKPISDVFEEKYKVIRIDKLHINGATTSFDKLGDITFVIVPTPSMSSGYFNSAYIEDVLSKIKQKQTVVIISTMMPGETDRLQIKYKHLNLIYSPTFVALGTVKHDFTHPDFILVGTHNKKSIGDLIDVYTNVIKKNVLFKIMTPLEAEITKLTLNCYITTKITFANQIGNLCYRLGIKPNNILDAVGTDSRIGNKYFKAGLGYGGPCFPRDNRAMTAYIKENSPNSDMTIVSSLFEMIDFLNQKQVDEIIDRIEEKNPKKITFKSLSYKKNSDCTEDSQLLEIFQRLNNPLENIKPYKIKIGKGGDVHLDWNGIHE